MRALSVMITLKKMFSSKGTYFDPSEKLLLQTIGYSNRMNEKELRAQFIHRLRDMRDVQSVIETRGDDGTIALEIGFEDSRAGISEKFKSMTLIVKPLSGEFYLRAGDHMYEPTEALASTLPIFESIATVLKIKGIIQRDDIGEGGIYLLPEWAVRWIRKGIDLAFQEPGKRVFYFPRMEERSFQSVNILCEEDDDDGSALEIDGDSLIKNFVEMLVERLHRTLVKRERECFNWVLMNGDDEREYGKLFETIVENRNDYSTSGLISIKGKYDRLARRHGTEIQFSNIFSHSERSVENKFLFYCEKKDNGAVKWEYPPALGKHQIAKPINEIPIMERMVVLWAMKEEEDNWFDRATGEKIPNASKPSSIFNPYYKDGVSLIEKSSIKYVDALSKLFRSPEAFAPNTFGLLSKRMMTIGFELIPIGESELIIRSTREKSIPEIHIDLQPAGDEFPHICFQRERGSGEIRLFPHMIMYTKAYEAMQFFLEGSGCLDHIEDEYSNTKILTDTFLYTVGTRDIQELAECYSAREGVFEYLKDILPEKESERMCGDKCIESLQFRINEGILEMNVHYRGEEKGVWLMEAGRIDEQEKIADILYKQILFRSENGFLDIVRSFTKNWRFYYHELTSVWGRFSDELNDDPSEVKREDVTVFLDRENDRIVIDDSYFIDQPGLDISIKKFIFNKRDYIQINPENHLLLLYQLYKFLGYGKKDNK